MVAPALVGHYVYDGWNRLAAVRTDYNGLAGAVIVEYRYDGLGRRIARLAPDGSTWDRTDYHYNESGQVLEERSGEAQPKETVPAAARAQYVWDIRYVDAPVVRFYDGNLDGDVTGGAAEGDSRLYYTTDANWNVTALVDASSGEVVERYVYDPYGAVSIFAGARDGQGNTTTEWQPRSVSLFDNQILYSGYRRDPVTGLYHTDTREYDASLGRWLSRDPAGGIDGSNLYQYVSGNPTAYVDPTGLFEIKFGIQEEPAPGYFVGRPPGGQFGSYKIIHVYDYGVLGWLLGGPAYVETKFVPARQYDNHEWEAARRAGERGCEVLSVLSGGAGVVRGAMEIGLSFTSQASAQEFLTGRDCITGEWLSAGAWLMSAVGIIPGVGSVGELRHVAKARKFLDGLNDARRAAGLRRVPLEAEALARAAQAGGSKPVEELLERALREAHEGDRVADAARVGARAVWSKPAMQRGIEIEQTLAKTEYSGWTWTRDLLQPRTGKPVGPNFDLVDFQRGSNLVSLKTVDTTGATWMGRMQEHIVDLGTRGATVDGVPARMWLDLRVQPGGLNAARPLVDFGVKNNVTVIIKEFP